MFNSYSVYILQCSDGTFYTGITTDVVRRLHEHNSSSKGAKYTRSRRPVRLLYHEGYNDKSSACKREYVIKRMSRAEKELLITTQTELK